MRIWRLKRVCEQIIYHTFLLMLLFHQSQSLVTTTTLILTLNTTEASDSKLQVTTCESNQYYSGNKCCSQCPAGTGLQSQCDKHNDTLCAICTAGETYQSQKFHTDICQACSSCGDNEYLRHECATTSDSVCECIMGYYRNAEEGQCKKCAKCPIGWGASSQCSATSNTVCTPCSERTFSSTESILGRCITCTECGPDEFALHKCSITEDTVCLKIPQSSESENDREECKGTECVDQSYLYTAPLYCAVLGAIVLGLVIYVGFRCISRKRAQSYPKLQYKPVEYQLPTNYTYNTQLKQANQQYVYLHVPGHRSPVNVGLRYKELPSNTRRSVLRSLACDGSWLQLAHYLGFNPSEISSIQEKSQTDPKGQPPVYHLINEWTRRDSCTVGLLVQALACMNRLDLISIIQSANSMNGSEAV